MEGNIENESYQTNNSCLNNPPVSVNIVINDPECAAYISSVGIFILYYCNHCGMAADSLQCLAKHLIQSGTHSTNNPSVNIKQHIDSLTLLANERLQVNIKNDGTNNKETSDESYSSDTSCRPNGVAQNSKDDIDVLEFTNTKDEQVESHDEEVDDDCNNVDVNGDNIQGTNTMEEIKPKSCNNSNETSNRMISDLKIIERSMFIEDYLNFVDENVDTTLAKRKFQETSKESSIINDIVVFESSEYDNSSLMNTSNHSDILALSCKHCPLLIFSSTEELYFHKQCHSNELPGYNFKCCLCNHHVWESKEWHQMRQHLHKVHMVNFRCKCTECKEDFESVEALREHKIKLHRLYCKFKEDGCKYCTNSEFDLQLHHNCHQTASDFHCCECNYKNRKLKQNTWTFIREHIAKKHVHLLDQKNQCLSCHSTFLDSESFQSHSIICKKLDSVKHKCMICSKANYVTLPNLRQHLQKHCNNSSVIVNTKFKKALDMKQKEVSMNDIYYILVPKGKGESTKKQESIFSTESFAVNRDIVMKFPSDIVDEKSQNSIVEIKESSFDGEESDNVQSEISTTQASNEMPEKLVPDSSAMHSTGVKFHNDESNLGHKTKVKMSFQEKYNDSVNDNGIYKCNMCYKKLKSQKNFLRHMAKRHPLGHDRTQCRVCSKTFRTQNQCKNHYHYQHAGNKRKYKKYDSSKKSNRLLYCESCTYTTPHPTRLRNHVMSTHLGVMPYKCDKCAYATNEHSDLRRHKNKHLGIKKYECEHCDYRAAQRWLLANHCLKQHNIELPPHRPNVDFLGSAGSLRRQHNHTVVTSVTSAEDKKPVDNYDFPVNSIGEVPVELPIEENTLIEYLEVPEPTRQIIFQPDTQLVTEVIFLQDNDII